MYGSGQICLKCSALTAFAANKVDSFRWFLCPDLATVASATILYHACSSRSFTRLVTLSRAL